MDGGTGFTYAAPMATPDELWAPAVDAFPAHQDVPQIVGVTDVEGLLVAPPPELRGPCTTDKVDVLRQLKFVRIVIRSVDDTATLNLDNGQVVNRAPVVKPIGRR